MIIDIAFDTKFHNWQDAAEYCGFNIRTRSQRWSSTFHIPRVRAAYPGSDWTDGGHQLQHTCHDHDVSGLWCAGFPHLVPDGVGEFEEAYGGSGRRE